MADETVERLVVEVEARLDKFRKNMGSARKIVKSMEDRFTRLRGVVTKVGARMKRVASKFRANVISMKGAIVGLVGGVVLKKIAGFINQITKMGDEIAKTARKVGIGVETLSGLRLAAELSGSSFQELSGGFRRLSSAASDARDGLAESQRAFDRLGVSVTDQNGDLRSMEAIFFDVADAIQGTSNATEAAALAQDVLGRAGLNLIPLLKGGSEAMREQIEEARKLGIVFTEKDAKAAEEFRDSLSRLKFSVIGLSRSLLNDLVPALTTSFGALKDSFVEAQEGGENFSKTITRFVKGLVFATIGAVEIMKSAWTGFLLILESARSTFLGLSLAIAKGFDSILTIGAEFFTEFRDGFNAVFKAVAFVARSFATIIIESIGGTLKGIVDLTADSLLKLSDLAAKIPGETSQALASKLLTASGAARSAALSIGEMTEKSKEAVNNFARIEDPATKIATGLLKAQNAIRQTSQDLNKELRESQDRLKGLAESEAIPFWERAKRRIVELNNVMIEQNRLLDETKDKQEKQAKSREEQIQTILTKWQEWFGVFQDTTKVMKEATMALWDTFKQQAGDAISAAIVDGQNLGVAFTNIFKNLLRQAISVLAKMAIQFALQAAAGAAAASIIGSAHVATNLANVFSGAFAATAAIPFVGPLLAPGVAAGALAAATAGTAAAQAAGAALGARPMQAGGLVTGPTFAMIGEAGPEVVIPLDRLGGMGGGPQTIILEIDGEVLTEIVVQNMPDIIRAQVGSEA